ncbi:MAG: sugar ABC transporter ATP-binding protein [Phycisphaerales bacterium]|nr:MAG: sugar ABC transporter ATP-binding protein [Phycisphaerales bacterium]
MSQAHQTQKPSRNEEPQEPCLVAEHISKRFGITQALDDVSVSFLAGEVHALMGENGAGKSTLGKVIAGLHAPDSGVIRLDGRELPLGSISDAFNAGVRIVHQELAQCPNLSVAENLCLHDIPRTRLRTVDYRAMADRADKLVHRLEPRIDVTAPLGELSPGWRQICQIAAALDDRSSLEGSHASAPRVIVFDEPTSSLAEAEVARLHEIVCELARQGLCVVYVSHRMGEIFACCDRTTVLRDGRFVATSVVSEIDEPTLVEQMIGRRLQTPGVGQLRNPMAAAIEAEAEGDEHHRPPPKAMAPSLVVENLSSPGRLEDISISVRPGEILGVGGLVGSGRSELLDAIFGLDKAAKGLLKVESKPVRVGDTRAMIRRKVGYVPEDRRRQGLFFDLGVDENTIEPVLPAISGRVGLRRARAELALINQRFGEFRVKAAWANSLPSELSGGNQQKLLIARWMAPDVRVLLLDEPTRGIDVGAKAEIYRFIRAAADRGVAIVLVSSEMPELLALADRIIVMNAGRIAGELEGEAMTQRNILTLATRERADAPAQHPASSGEGRGA